MHGEYLRWMDTRFGLHLTAPGTPFDKVELSGPDQVKRSQKRHPLNYCFVKISF